MSPISWNTRARSPLVRSAASSARTSAGASSSWGAGSAAAAAAPAAPTAALSRDGRGFGRSLGIPAMVAGRDAAARLGRRRLGRRELGRRPGAFALRGDHLVPAAVLRLVEGPIGALDDARDRLVAAARDRRPDRHADRRDADPGEIEPFDRDPHAL